MKTCQGHSEISEWVFQIKSAEEITASLKSLGFVHSSKASHLLDYMSERGSFLPDPEWDEEVDIEAVWKESRENHAQNPDALLNFYCAKCRAVTPGKKRCVNTGCCEECSDNYEPYIPKELW
jgi:hypothetical protein